jgi:predicted TIM-barrel fold metal-dependent hydrolase
MHHPDTAMTPVCDSHVHVFDPVRFPYVSGRRFTPGAATVAQLQQHLTNVGAQRVVLVQPSVYGDQHGALLDALGALNMGDGGSTVAARGVAVLSARSTAAQLEVLAAAGVVGARLNLAVHGECDAATAWRQWETLVQRTPTDWHIQLHLPLPVVAALSPRLAASRRVHVIDHLGLPAAGLQVGHAHWQALMRLLDSGRTYIKLSAPYLASGEQTGHADLEGLVRSLVATAPTRLLWGSNWPHTLGNRRSQDANPGQPEPFRTVDDRHWLAQCRQWAGPHADALLDQNAEALYRFPVSPRGLAPARP